MSQIKYPLLGLLLVIGLAVSWFFLSRFLSAPFVETRQPLPPLQETVATDANRTVHGEGKNLFSANCATCHALDKNLTGPALRGVESRGPWTSRQKLIQWVKNPSGMIEKEPYLGKLVQDYSGQIMPAFSQLTDAQIEAIFDYITKSPVAVPVVVPVALR